MSVLEDSDLVTVQAEDKCYQKKYIVTWILFILQMVFLSTVNNFRGKSLACDLPVPGIVDYLV